MNIYEKIGRALAKGFLYINDDIYLIEEACTCSGVLLLFILRKPDGEYIRIDALRNKWGLYPMTMNR